ncbi:MAG: PLD nuclease N-terminal domain-containing protein [Phycisphaeraceae bacterium]
MEIGCVCLPLGGLVALAGFVLWIWALIDAIQNPKLDDTMRIVWVLVIVFTQIIGAAIYLLIGRDG